MKEDIRQTLLSTGAVAAGFAAAQDVGEEVSRQYEAWIGEGHHAGMEYLARHSTLKKHPRHVMEDTATVISLAYSYAPSALRAPSLPAIACYAYGKDYHDVIRQRLNEVVGTLRERYGGNWRVCVDTAPIAERYWAVKAGIGKRGENGSVIVDNCGSLCFLAEVLTSLQTTPDAPSEASCIGCGACRKACPTGALLEVGTIDSRRCLNYLTIEHRGEWTGEMLETMHSRAGRESLYGCDICQTVCPHNKGAAPSAIMEFAPAAGILTLDADDVAAMTAQGFSAFFKGSAIKRAKFDGLLRNAGNVLEGRQEASGDDNPALRQEKRQ